MISVKLPIYDRVHEDYLRYRFDSWEAGPVKISASHPIGQGIVAAVRGRYDKPQLNPQSDYLELSVPNNAFLHLDRYPYHSISVEDALRIRWIVSMDYYTEVSRWVIVGMSRRLDMKTSITWFLDALQLMAPYELHMNYEQIRKMMTRDMRKAFSIVREMNEHSVYKSFT